MYNSPNSPTEVFGIDVATRTADRLIRRLAMLKTTVAITHAHPYWQDPTVSQVYVTTTMSMPELEDWLWRVKHGAEYFGVFRPNFEGDSHNV